MQPIHTDVPIKVNTIDYAMGNVHAIVDTLASFLVSPINIGIGVYATQCLCVAGALSEGHRGRNVKAALGASVVLMD